MDGHWLGLTTQIKPSLGYSVCQMFLCMTYRIHFVIHRLTHIQADTQPHTRTCINTHTNTRTRTQSHTFKHTQQRIQLRKTYTESRKHEHLYREQELTKVHVLMSVDICRLYNYNLSVIATIELIYCLN